MTVNKVILLGNLGTNPEIKISQGGKEIGSFSLATSESWKDKNSGEKKEKTEWHNIKVFGDKCRVLQFIEKGSRIYLEGKLQTEKYTDKNGVEKYATKIIADTISIIKGKEKDEIDAHNKAKADGYQPQTEEITQTEEDDEIPF